MPIPRRASSDFFVPGLNQLLFPEENEAILYNDDEYIFSDSVFFLDDISPYLIDFGYSRDDNQQESTSSEYIHQQESTSLEFDVYSFGILLYYLITEKDNLHIRSNRHSNLDHNHKEKLKYVYDINSLENCKVQNLEKNDFGCQKIEFNLYIDIYE